MIKYLNYDYHYILLNFKIFMFLFFNLCIIIIFNEII